MKMMNKYRRITYASIYLATTAGPLKHIGPRYFVLSVARILAFFQTQKGAIRFGEKHIRQYDRFPTSITQHGLNGIINLAEATDVNIVLLKLNKRAKAKYVRIMMPTFSIAVSPRPYSLNAFEQLLKAIKFLFRGGTITTKTPIQEKPKTTAKLHYQKMQVNPSISPEYMTFTITNGHNYGSLRLN